MTKSFYYSISGNKDEGKSQAKTLIDIPVFVGKFSIISGFTIIDDDEMTNDVVLGMKFCKKYVSCQRNKKKLDLGLKLFHLYNGQRKISQCNGKVMYLVSYESKDGGIKPRGSAGREFLEKSEHFSHPTINPFALLLKMAFRNLSILYRWITLQSFAVLPGGKEIEQRILGSKISTTVMDPAGRRSSQLLA
ncbi:hypothetical protein Tco_0521163 [Tanacetum coccineum]